ncbi:MAG: mercuric transporter MerT family protein [Nitrosomonas sp.]
MSKKESKLPIIGGTIAAVGAGICCAGPLVLLMLGVSGSWISNLTLLEPYRPLFILAVFVLFGWAGWNVYRPIEDCEPGSACAVPQVRKQRQIIFLVTALIALALVTSVYWIPVFM